MKIIETADYVFNANLSYDQIDEWANKIDFITRKLAHMTEYFALAIAVSFPLYVYGLHHPSDVSGGADLRRVRLRR